MKNLTNNFSSNYQPVKALLIYNKQTEEAENNSVYVESYDIGKFGNPINAHPLTMKETLALSGIFQTAQELKTGFLRCKGLMPGKVLYVNPEKGGYAVWYTPPQEVPLFFFGQPRHQIRERQSACHDLEGRQGKPFSLCAQR